MNERKRYNTTVIKQELTATVIIPARLALIQFSISDLQTEVISVLRHISTTNAIDIVSG